MDKSEKHLGKTLGALAGVSALAAATSYMTTRFFVRACLDREQPRMMKETKRLVSGGKGNDAFKAYRRNAAQALLEADTEPVSITARDGVKLAGHWLEGRDPQRILIAVHGWRTSWNRDFGMVAPFLRESGCSVLYIEQRGQNGSGGEYMGLGVTEQFDCQEWVRWVIREKSNTLPIYLYGISMGAATVLMAAGLELPENVHGIVADCGFTSPDDIWRHVSEDNLHVPYELHRYAAGNLYRKRNRLDPFHYSTTDALRKTDVPVLLIHGDRDRFVPVSMAYENYEACAAPKRMLIVPGAGHVMSYFMDPEDYEDALRYFWQDFDQTERPMADAQREVRA